MALNIPENVKIIFDRMGVDIINELSELDPFLRNSLIRALTVADANAFFESYKTLEQLEKLTFWDTTEGPTLERWAAIFGIIRNAATKASGFVTFTGTAGSNIALNSQFTADSGNIYQTTASGQITAESIAVSLLTRVGSTVTVITGSDHGLASNVSILIAGAVETEYNGQFPITVTGLNTFTYSILTTPTSPATGSITVSGSWANVAVESLQFGQAQNLLSGTPVSLSSPISGIDNTGFVSFLTVDGGSDVENDDSLRDRFLFRIQNPFSLFSPIHIEAQAKTVTGVTRVWVFSVDSLLESVTATTVTRDGVYATFNTGTPHGLQAGQIVTISGAIESEYNVLEEKILVPTATSFGYVVSGSPSTPATGTIIANYGVSALGQSKTLFVRDNDDDLIPGPIDVQNTKDAIDQIKPAQVASSDVIVVAPIPISVPFTFSALSPNTLSMQTAITNSLDTFFASSTNVGQDLKIIDYESVINNTLDSGGNGVNSFVLSTPTTDISITSSELAVIGAITYP